MWKISKSPYKCEFCGEPIEDNAEYIENLDGEKIHDDCASNPWWLVDWLGGKHGRIDLMAELADIEYEQYCSMEDEW